MSLQQYHLQNITTIITLSRQLPHPTRLYTGGIIVKAYQNFLVKHKAKSLNNKCSLLG